MCCALKTGTVRHTLQHCAGKLCVYVANGSSTVPRFNPHAKPYRKEPVLDHIVQAAIDAVGGTYAEDTGHYGTLRYTGCADRDRAKEIKQALYRSARHLGVSLFYSIVKEEDDTYSVEFTPVNKAHGRAHVVSKYGSTRDSWPYDPRAPKKEKS
jgi:hypothetical protein